MKRAIWKYLLRIADSQAICMPKGAEILAVDEQSGFLTLWAMVNRDAPERYRVIQVCGTGDPLPDNLGDHIATVVMREGHTAGLVWHVFDGGEQK